MFDRTDGAAKHRSNKKRRCKRAAGRSTQERNARHKYLQRRQQQQHLPDELPVHHLIDDRITRAHYLRHLNSNQSDHQTRCCRLKVKRPVRPLVDLRPRPGNPFE